MFIQKYVLPVFISFFALQLMADPPGAPGYGGGKSSSSNNSSSASKSDSKESNAQKSSDSKSSSKSQSSSKDSKESNAQKSSDSKGSSNNQSSAKDSKESNAEKSSDGKNSSNNQSSAKDSKESNAEKSSDGKNSSNNQSSAKDSKESNAQKSNDNKNASSNGDRLSFGDGYGSANSGMIGGGQTSLGYGASVSGTKSATNSNAPSSSSKGLSMGTVVSETNRSPSSTPNGGYDSAGNYHPVGESVPPSQSASRTVVNALASALNSTTVVGAISRAATAAGQVAYDVTKNTLNTIGKIVEPHAKALVNGTSSAVSAGKNAAAELSRPQIREALGIDSSRAKNIAGKVEARAFYSAVYESYKKTQTPVDRQWVPSGPLDHAQRYAGKPNEQVLSGNQMADQKFRDGAVAITTPDDNSLWTPNRVDIVDRPIYGILDPVQRVGASHSVQITGPREDINAIAIAYGLNKPKNSVYGLQVSRGPLAGGIVMVVDEKTPEDNLNVIDALTHELVHAGDAAIAKDLESMYSKRDELSPEERKVIEDRMMAASLVENRVSVNEIPSLSGVIKDEYLGMIVEQRAFTQQMNTDLYPEQIAVRQGISIEEARQIADTISNDPVLNEISARMEDHANEMLSRE